MSTVRNITELLRECAERFLALWEQASQEKGEHE